LFGRHDPALYRLSQRVLAGDYAWLEDGIARHPRLQKKGGAPAPAEAPPEPAGELVRA
jgi:hypothetical protein